MLRQYEHGYYATWVLLFYCCQELRKKYGKLTFLTTLGSHITYFQSSFFRFIGFEAEAVLSSSKLNQNLKDCVSVALYRFKSEIVSSSCKCEVVSIFGWGSKFRMTKCRTAGILGKLETSNIEITNIELYVFLFSKLFLIFTSVKIVRKLKIYDNLPNSKFFGILIVLQIVKFWNFANFRNWTISEFWLFDELVNLGNFH